MTYTTARHLSDDELVLCHFQDTADLPRMSSHLESCGECRARYARLERLLAAAADMPVPEPDTAFESRVWWRLEPCLQSARSRWWQPALRPSRLALASATAALIVAAFVAGWVWRGPVPAAPSHEASTATVLPLARQRVLLVALSDHLDRSHVALSEIANAEPDRPVDISTEQTRARDLLSVGRILRQATEEEGDRALARVLDDIERVLLDIVNGPSQLTPAQVDRIRSRIQSEGLIFKVRVAGSVVREREARAASNLLRESS